MRRLALGLWLVILSLVPIQLLAHEIKLSDSELEFIGGHALWTHKVHLGDFDAKFSRADSATLQNYLPQRISLSAGGQAC